MSAHNHSHSHSRHSSVSGGHDSDSESSDSSQTANPIKRAPPKKRNRAALSCTLCRERKIKCDRTIPCQQCIKRGDADSCMLDPTKRGPKPKQRANGRSTVAAPLAAQPMSTSSSHQGKRKSIVDAPASQQLPHSAPFEAYAGMMFAQPQRQASSAASTSSATSEVDSIKARLFQLEQMLAAQQVNSSGQSPNGASNSASLSDAQSAPGLSPRYPWTSAPFAASPVNQASASGMSASPATINSHRSGSASASSPASSRGQNFATLFAQQQQQQQQQQLQFNNAPGQASGANGTDTASRHSRRSESVTPQSSTKGAKGGDVVMANSSGHHGARGEIDSDTEDAAMVLENLAMGPQNECGEKKQLKPERAALEIIERAPTKTIRNFVEEDKAEDIMTEGKYRYERKTNKTKEDKETTECDKDELRRMFLRQNPDAEFGPDGKRLSPAQRVCGLLSDHNKSLFNLVWGPETFLGWGMGWAFTAAEAADDMMSVSEVVGCKGALQREAVLRAIIRSLPQRELAVHLVNIFDNRVKFLAGNCFHVPTFRKEMEAFYDLDTVEKRARVINFVDPAWLSLMLMIFVLALHFHPCERPEIALHLFDGRTIHLWRSAARTSLVLARYQSSTSMAVLQTIILINLLANGSGKESYNLSHIAISNALEMGLHRLGDEDKQPKAGENSAIAIRREMAKRIWHQLTFTDWCSAPLHAGAYRIHPHQFNTPLPGNYMDKDLCKQPLPAPRPESEHTDMSYPLSMLKLADISRKNIDLLYADKSRRIMCADMAFLDTAYRGLLEQAPSFYKIGSIEGEGDNIEVERWLFQQSVFHKLLRLHRPQLSSRTSARTSCVLLARSILDMQRRIRSRCSVVDRLFVNLAQSFSAAIVLCLDLLQTRPAATMREIVRGEISEALKALRHVGASHHTTENSIRVIEALLAEEEARWNNPQQSAATSSMTGKRSRRDAGQGSSGERRKEMLSLALRVVKAAQGDDVSDDKAAAADGEKASSVSVSLDVPMNGQATEQQLKDQQSRQMLDQLLAGRSALNEPQSFANIRFQTSVFDNQSSTVAPNGLDFGTGWTPPDDANGGAQFDLSKFLAEAETNSSPGNDTAVSSNASDSGHSSLHGGRANSTSSGGRLSHSSSFSAPGQRQQRSGVRSSTDQPNSPMDAFNTSSSSGSNLSPSAFENPAATGLDGFWNWILTQGAIGSASSVHEQQAPAQPFIGAAQNNGTGSGVPSGNQQLQQQQQYVDALSQNMAGGMGGSPIPTGDQSNAAPNPFALPSRSTPAASLSSSSGQAQNHAANGTGGANDVPFYSVGTPSAGVGSSWMSTPGLFDLALEFGEGLNVPSGSQSSAAATTNV